MITENLTPTGPNRRQLLTRAGLIGAAALGTGFLDVGAQSQVDAALPATYQTNGRNFRVNDNDILNFALNLEYLEAEFFNRAAFGTGLSAADTGGTSNVAGGSMVPFTSAATQQFAQEIATDEANHVRFLRAALGKKAVPEPPINFTAAFNAIGVGAGLVPAGGTFNPFADELSFMITAFIFEDNGVEAYHGAAPYVSKTAYLTAAAGILAVEGYHAGQFRNLVFQQGPAAIATANKVTTFISSLADAADPANTGTEQTLDLNGTANIVQTDANSIAFSRTFAQVLNIAYGGTATGGHLPTPGGFFPTGLNGRIR